MPIPTDDEIIQEESDSMPGDAYDMNDDGDNFIDQDSQGNEAGTPGHPGIDEGTA